MSADLAKVKQIETLALTLPIIQEEVERLKRAVVSRVRTEMRDGSLTPEASLAFWCEYLAAESLLRAFEQRLKVAQGVGAQNAALLTGDGVLR
jgi:hypothetical protein